MRLTLRGVGPAEGPHPHGSPVAIAEGFGHEDDESCRGRVAEEGEGGQEEEEAAEVVGAGTREDTDNDDDDGDGDNDEVMEEEETVADDIEWDNLENEDALTGIGSSL